MDTTSVDPPDVDEPHEGELVVDLRYIDLVVERIGTTHPKTTLTWTGNEQLGLALVTVPGVGKVDNLLMSLRRWSKETFDGWVPDLDHNWSIRSVVAFPESKPMLQEITKATQADWPHATDKDSGRGVRVGVLDTGLYPHPDLAGHYLAPADALYTPPEDTLLQPWAGHATAIVGCVVANAPAAEIIVRRVLDETCGRATVWQTAMAMAGFVTDHVDILTVALGCRTVTGPPLALERAVALLRPDTMIVAAAGNHGLRDYRHRPTWPAALPGVVAIGAFDDSEAARTLAPFSPQLPWVCATGPGVDVVSTFLRATVETADGEITFGGYASGKGTSFACANVAGAIAARTKPPIVTAEMALAELLAEADVVRPYAWRP